MNALRIALPVLIAAAALSAAHAATVSARLSANETTAGTPVILNVQISGSTDTVAPDAPDVEGLRIALQGQMFQRQWVNGAVTITASYNYLVVPMREGEFEIPAFDVFVDNRRTKTEPLKLTVRPGAMPTPRTAPALPLPSSPPPGVAPEPQQDDGKIPFPHAEIVVPRTSVYAGEVVPADIRFYIDKRLGIRLLDGHEPQVQGEGFTVQKLSPPTQSEQTIDGRDYRVLTYRTLLTAVKSGEAQLPIAALQLIVQVPVEAPSGMPSIFNQLLGSDLMDERPIVISSKPRSLRVDALPAKGRPSSFSGAVGDFTLSASADPVKTNPGDPLNLRIAVSGRGNFDAMGDPSLVDTKDWRVYPPTSRFEKSDATGYSGTKTFEFPMVAQISQTRTPVAEFSYFDPAKSEYVTLTSEPVPIEAAAEPAAPGASGAAVADATATPEPEAGPRWLTKTHSRSWKPVMGQPAFWIASGAAALVLAALAATFAIRRARTGPAARRAALIRERERLLAELSRENLAENAFHAKAIEALSLQARLTGEAGPFELVRSREAEGRDVGALHGLLSRADELKFSGGGGAAMQTDVAQRRALVLALKEVCR